MGNGPDLLGGTWWPWFWLVMIGLLLASHFFLDQAQPGYVIAYSELKAQTRAGNVADVTFHGRRITGSYRTAQKIPIAPGAQRSSNPLATQDAGESPLASHFVTTLPVVDDPELLPLLEAQGVEVRAKSEEPLISPLLIGLLPLLLLLALLFYSGRMMRQQFGDMGSRLTGFGQSRAKRFEKTTTQITFDDVAGLENAKLELREVVEFLKQPDRFQKLGARTPHGILLMGPPGTGKTLMAKAVAGEAEVPFFSVSGSEFVELFVGVGASRVRDMFQTAKKEAPAILFIDEIDSVGRSRGTGLGGGHDEREQTLNQILAEMDGFEGQEAVVAIAATNRPDVLDSALLRPGRFDRKITLELPQREARRRILEVHTRRVPLVEDVDLEELAKATIGFSGADLSNLVNEAALFAARRAKEKVDRIDFNDARDRVLLGSEREEMLSESEKRITAYHEAGHALIAWLEPQADPLRKVTIIPRGRALGVTEMLPDEDRHNVTRSYLDARLAVLLGGRAAEKIIFGEASSGAADDLKKVTQLARNMICQWGMSEKLGPVSFRHGEEHVFLGREMAQARDFSEHTAQLIDEEVQHMVMEIEDRVERRLAEHRDDLETLAQALLERESIDLKEIEELLA